MKKLHLLFLILTGFIFISCSYKKHEIKLDLEIKKENKAFFKGKIKNNANSKKVFYLVLYKENIHAKNEKNRYQLVDFSTHLQSGDFNFNVTLGTYYLHAFQNPQNITKEHLGYEFKSKKITLTSQNNTSNIIIQMPKKPVLVNEENILIQTSDNSLIKNISFENITSMDNPIFKDENTNLGLWDPVSFTKEIGGGIYMLEPYSPKKIPILFVHGMNGSPKIFKTILKSIDREKYQAWFFYYASGANLNYSVDFLKTLFDAKLKRNKFKEIIVVGHSMGGLVSRAFINQYKHKLKFPLYITISSPWNGKAFVSFGKKYAKYIVPSFANMIPGSAFQKNIMNEPYPKELQHHLFFSYKGEGSFILEQSNDGVISVESQLHEKVQKDAKSIYGFNQEHSDILKDPLLIKKIKEILK